jgi:D-glycerate 3-kinase
MSAHIIGEKSPLCISFILDLLAKYPPPPPRPFIIGLNGIQGVGKTTLVTALASQLRAGHNLTTLVCSIDDFYLPHAQQLRLAASHPDNPLVQHRGQPGTHDIALAGAVFEALRHGKATRLPRYDKAAFSGRGDRVDECQWTEVNGPDKEPVRVVILEGWCVGFRALEEGEVRAKWLAPSQTLATHEIEHLLFINEQLRAYGDLTDLFDAFIHIDAEDTHYVYGWRLEQEKAMREVRGSGMTDDEVIAFVNGYYPAYELFSDRLRSGVFPNSPGRQLRLVVGRDRSVRETMII